MFRESVDCGGVGVVRDVPGCQKVSSSVSRHAARVLRSHDVHEVFGFGVGQRSPMSPGSQQFFDVQAQAGPTPFVVHFLQSSPRPAT